MISEQDFIPYQATDLRGGRVLVLAPHPDDETFGCGGSLLLHRRYGDPVRVVFVTSGERGDWQGDGNAESVRVRREAEAGRALAFLEIDEWEFWRLPDRGVVADGELVERILGAVKSFQPTLIYAPSPLEVHPDHRAVAQGLFSVLRGSSHGLRVGFYEIGYPTPINALVDVSAAWENKQNAMKAYESQISGPNYLSVSDGLARFRTLTLPPSVKAAEGFRLVAAEDLERDSIWRWEAVQRPIAVVSGPPAVSVIVRTKDRPQFLRDALQSLDAQTFRDFEVVVVNDGGCNVEPIFAEFPALRLKSVFLDRNQGRGAASNAGIEAASGEFIAYLDDDDLWYPPHLQTLHGFLAQNQHFGGAYTDAYVARYRADPESSKYQLVDKRVVYSQDFDKNLLLFGNYIPNLCLMHRRSVIDRVGRFDVELPILEDWDFLLRISQEYPLHRIAQRTAEYRLRDDGTNISTMKPWGGFEEVATRIAIYRRYHGTHTPEVEAQVYGKLMEGLWEQRDLRASSEIERREMEKRHARRERDALDLQERLRQAEERASLLENEADTISSELIRAGQKIGAQAEEIAVLTATAAAIGDLHQEVARRQELIDSILKTRTWRYRDALRKLFAG